VLKILGQPEEVSKTTTQQGDEELLFFNNYGKTINIGLNGKVNYINEISSEKSNFKSNDNYFNKAIAAYQETLVIDSNYFDALFNLGAIYFNKGGEVINEANKLPISETAKYDKMLADGNNFLNLALPYLEKCEVFQPTDKPTLISLKEIYTRLNMKAKLEVINAKLSTL
jgi:tetratricopeptide (TPR) repeat protein